MRALPRTNAEHSPRSIDEREAFSMPYWLARNGPGRLGGHGHSPYRLSRRGIRHATFDHKRRSRDAAKRRVRANAGKRGACMGRRRPFFLLFLPLRPDCAVAQLPLLRHPRLFRRIISLVARHVHARYRPQIKARHAAVGAVERRRCRSNISRVTLRWWYTMRMPRWIAKSP